MSMKVHTHIHVHTHTLTDQFNDLNKHPVVGRVGHELEEDGSKGEVVTGILTSQLTYHTHGSTLHSCI